MQTPLDKYLSAHCSLHSDALDWIEKQTNLNTNYPQMLSGRVQGQFLRMLVQLSGARNVLEIGTFTGYSAVCLAMGLPEDGHLDALEINDELEDLIREGWRRSGLEAKMTLHIADARRTLEQFADQGRRFDLVFVDANKREYDDYYELLLPMVPSGGLILADDVLWDGKVYAERPDVDRQTQSLIAFNDKVASDPRVECVTVPLRDGITLIRKI